MIATILLSLGLVLGTIIWQSRRSRSVKPLPPPAALPSLLIPAYTSHARLLPVPAKHAFSYPLLYLGIDIDALEAGSLDIPPLFSYGGRPWTKILGIRSYHYLSPGPGGLRTKLENVLEAQGVSKREIGRAWLLSMPSYLGFEGINPLSVWYIYDKTGSLMAVVLEVHNTFGEKHAYVLPVDSQFKEGPTDGYDHSWIFPRSFHVSPFNSRDGYYRLDLINPFRTPGDTPTVKVFLKLLTPDKTPKLWAVLASHPTHSPVPLTPSHAAGLLGAIARWPLTLFLSTPRILYHAYKLHYDKKLAVYPRPEPAGSGAEEEWNPPQANAKPCGGGIGWQVPGLAEKVARSVVLPWLEARCQHERLRAGITFRDDRSPLAIGTSEERERVLEISTGDPKFFANLLSAQSAPHSLVLAPELLTTISQPPLFETLFGDYYRTVTPDRWDRWTAAIRHSHTLYMLKYSSIPPPPDLVRGSRVHWTATLPFTGKVKVLFVVILMFVADWLETELLHLIGARFVEGHEPWRIWDRALRRQYQAKSGSAEDDRASSRSSRSEDWVDLGSVQY